ncbi:MAG: hypothetical protein N4A45_05985 [Flavobacteriales bacterium]|jgi:hypothetical protein|nr:hypothetical protein [Flavobacteriales bacterium]
MRSILIVFFAFFLGFSSYAQSDEHPPFGIRAYRYLGGLPSKNISFGSAKSRSNRKGKPFLYIDASFRSMFHLTNESFQTTTTTVDILDASVSNTQTADIGIPLDFMENGLRLRAHIPLKVFTLTASFTQFLPYSVNNEHHLITLNDNPYPYMASASVGTYSYALETNYFFALAKKLWYLNVGVEGVNSKYDLLPNGDGEIKLPNGSSIKVPEINHEFSRTYANVGFGVHFHRGWFSEVQYMTTSVFDKERPSSAISFSIGYRMFFKF